MNGRKPTRAEKILMKSRGLDAREWLVLLDYSDHYVLAHRHGNVNRVLPKGKEVKA